MATFGVLGGSFNPVHNAHLAIAHAVRRSAGLDGVILMPAGWSPLKGRDELADAGHRLAMLRLAVDGQEGLSVSDLELGRPGRSYTFDTLAALSAAQPVDTFGWIIGADSLVTLPRWHRAAELLERWPVWSVRRPGYDVEPALAAVAEQLGTAAAERLRARIVDAPLLDLSATAVRARLRAGEAVGEWVPPAVAAYLAAHPVYR